MNFKLKEEFTALVPSVGEIGGEFTELANGWDMYLIPMNDIVVKHRLTEWLDSKTSITPKSRYGNNYEVDGEQMIARLTRAGLELYFGSAADNKLHPALWEDSLGRIRHAYVGTMHIDPKTDVGAKILDSLDEMEKRKNEDGTPFHTWFAEESAVREIGKSLIPEYKEGTIREVASITPIGCYALEQYPKYYYMSASNGALFFHASKDFFGRLLTVVIDAEWYSQFSDTVRDLFDLKSFDAFAKVLDGVNLHGNDHINMMNLTARAKPGEALWWKNIYAERGYDVPDVEAIAS